MKRVWSLFGIFLLALVVFISHPAWAEGEESTVTVSEIEVEPVRKIDGTQYKVVSYWDDQGNEMIFYRFGLTPKMLRVTLTDGSQISGLLWEVNSSLAEYGIQLNYSDSQEEDFLAGNPWGVGDYKASIIAGDKQWEYDVSIIPFPVENIEVEEPTLVEGICGEGSYWDDNTETWKYYPDYDLRPQQLTVTLTNGEIISGDSYDINYQLYERYGLDQLQFRSTQIEDYLAGNPWGVGKHKAAVCVEMHKNELKRWEYDIEIVPFPVESIEVPSITVTEEDIQSMGWSDGDDQPTFFYFYNVTPRSLSITLKDGGKIEGDYYTVSQKLETEYGLYIHTYDSQYDEYDSGKGNPPWHAGTYTAKAGIHNVETEYEVHIVPSPLKSIQVEPLSLMVGETTERYYWDEEGNAVRFNCYDTTPRRITMLLNDGSEISGDYQEVIDRMFNEYGLGFVLEDTQSDDARDGKFWEPGNHKASIRTAIRFGKEYEYDVLIVEELVPPVMENLKEAADIADEATDVFMEVEKQEEAITEQEEQKIAEAMAAIGVEYEVVGSYDVVIYSVQVDENGQVVEGSREEINELKKTVLLTFITPNAVGKSYQVIRIHTNPDGTVEVTLLDTKDNGDGTVSVESDKFSMYYLAEMDKPDRLPGDVNDDGQVTLMDLVRLCKYLSGYQVEINEANSDVNGDGNVTLMDLVRLCKRLAGYQVVLE